MEDQEIIQEFLLESLENLGRLDLEMVELERQPKSAELLASIFRTIHTIKGACGFLGFTRLERVAHAAESILSELRAGTRDLDTGLTSLILEAVDAIKRILASIEAGTGEGSEFEAPLLERLRAAAGKPAAAAALPAAPPPAVPSIAPATPAPAASQAPIENETPPAETSGSRNFSVADTALRVDVGLLDRLMDLVGELVLARNQVLQYNAQCDDSPLNAVSQRLNLITSELQEGVMKTRMQPIGVVWNKLPRIVRDLATSLKKQIDLEMEGAETELDRTIIEAIKDPLTHIVRNSCDHGIEAPEMRVQSGKPARGVLSLRAYHESGQVNIEIKDTGAGISPHKVKSKAIERGLITPDQAQRMPDREALNLIFAPGFSTAAQVTSISGRGVGMDVVRTSIERIGGTVDLISAAGQGTTVRMKIPLTLAIIPGLVVWSGGERFVVPQASLHELIRLEGESASQRIEYVHQTPVFRLRDRLIPLADLNAILGLPERSQTEDLSIVVLQAGEDRFGLIVDAISDTQEIVVKPLGAHLKGLNCYAGATIMGDGRIALILDIAGLASRSQVLSAQKEEVLASTETAARADQTRALLLFRAGPFERIAMPLASVSRLETIPMSTVERAAGRDVVQYRNRVMPLVPLAEMLGGAASGESEDLHVVVYRAGETDLGLVVDEISDIIQESVHSIHGSDRQGVLGSAIVGGKVTDFLDLEVVAGWAALSTTESLLRLQQALEQDAFCAVEQEVWR